MDKQQLIKHNTKSGSNKGCKRREKAEAGVDHDGSGVVLGPQTGAQGKPL